MLTVANRPPEPERAFPSPTAARLAVAAIIATAAVAAWRPASADAIGVREVAVTAPDRDAALTVTLWYPAGVGGVAEPVGENKVFEGAQARRDAEMADGTFPIVLLSHGGLRAAPNQSGWIASRLAGDGFIVAAVPPPRPADARAAVAEAWLRPSDLSATLTALYADPATAEHAAPGQVAAVGFFLGGTSGLGLAGARFDAEGYARSCDPPAAGPDCAWFADEGVDLREIDTGNLTRSNLDPRVGTIVAVDPELTASFSSDSLSKIAARVAVINLGRPGAIAPALDASGLQRVVPGATYAAVPDATPFSAMATCKPEGAMLLLAEGEDDAICSDPAAARERIHTSLAETIADAIRRNIDPR
jgi:predicted dienelactone hydrolase